MKKIVIIFAAVLVSGCASLKPTPEGQAVKVVENKPSGCKELGLIDTKGYALNKEDAWNYLMNKVVSKGGNTVRIENEINWSMGGTMVIGSNDYYAYEAYAYNCP